MHGLNTGATGARRPIIGVMGAGEPTPATLEAARRLGQLVAEAGWILLTGGRPLGVMDAASASAKQVPGTASEVALALTARRPTVLLGASPNAVAFFGTLSRGVTLHAVATPEAAIAVIEQEFGIPRWRAV